MAPVIERRLLSVKTAAPYLDRTERAIRHLYERGTLTPIRTMDGFTLTLRKSSASFGTHVSRSIDTH